MARPRAHFAKALAVPCPRHSQRSTRLPSAEALGYLLSSHFVGLAQMQVSNSCESSKCIPYEEQPRKKPAVRRARTPDFSTLQILLRPLIDAIQRLLKILDGIGNTEPQITFTEGAERRSRQPRDSRVVKQRVRQLLRRPSGLLDIGEGIKRALRQPAGESLDLI